MVLSRISPLVFFCTLALSAQAWCAQSTCQAAPEILAEFEKAAASSAAVTDPFGALKKAEPFHILSDLHPDNLFVHERYQDAMHEFGIEGHCQLLTKQYKSLEEQHPGDLMFRYLSIRTTVGRATPEAIQDLNELLQTHPDFAPAHRTLAEIYDTEAFRDRDKERMEREKYLQLCPGGAFTRRPPPVPAFTTLLEQAERLLAAGGDTDSIIEMTRQGLMELEWRSQRIRAFDWYSRDYKIQDARQLRAKYWQAWPVQVRAYRKAGRLQEAAEVLTTMERSLVRRVVTETWDGQYTLAQLYLEGGETSQANRKLDALQQLADGDKDPVEKKRRAGQIEKLRQLLPAGSK